MWRRRRKKFLIVPVRSVGRSVAVEKSSTFVIWDYERGGFTCARAFLSLCLTASLSLSVRSNHILPHAESSIVREF